MKKVFHGTLISFIIYSHKKADMKLATLEKEVEKEYHVSWYIICYKFFFGLAEAILGLSILIFSNNIVHIYKFYAAKELSEDPHDVLVHLTEGIIPKLLTHNTYVILYLLLLGSAKMAGAIGLMYKKNWGVDLLVGLTTLLFPFQLYNFLLHPSSLDFAYIVLGAFIALYLIEFKPKAWISRIYKLYGRKFGI